MDEMCVRRANKWIFRSAPPLYSHSRLYFIAGKHLHETGRFPVYGNSYIESIVQLTAAKCYFISVLNVLHVLTRHARTLAHFSTGHQVRHNVVWWCLFEAHLLCVCVTEHSRQTAEQPHNIELNKRVRKRHTDRVTQAEEKRIFFDWISLVRSLCW